MRKPSVFDTASIGKLEKMKKGEENGAGSNFPDRKVRKRSFLRLFGNFWAQKPDGFSLPGIQAAGGNWIRLLDHTFYDLFRNHSAAGPGLEFFHDFLEVFQDIPAP